MGLSALLWKKMMRAKILFVGDDAAVLAAYQRDWRKQFHIETALGADVALAAMKGDENYAVMVIDNGVAGMDGIDLLMKAEEGTPDTVRIVLAHSADLKAAMDALNHGHVFRFLIKPFAPDVLGMTLEAALRQNWLLTRERELLEKTVNGCIKLFTDILATMDTYSFGRAQILRDYTRLWVKSLELDHSWELEAAAMLTQIGLATVPPAVLQKIRSNVTLTGPEKDMVARVPEAGSLMLDSIPHLGNVARIILYHRKNFDGSGLPFDGVAREEIPIGSRILRVLSDLVRFEAAGTSKFKALEQMKTRVGFYDPRLVQAAFASFEMDLCAPGLPETSTQEIRMKELRIGQVLRSNIETRGGMMIAAAGTIVSQMVMEKLRNFDALSGIREPIRVAA